MTGKSSVSVIRGVDVSSVRPRGLKGPSLKTELISLTAFAAVTSTVWNALQYSTGYRSVLVAWGCLELLFYAHQRWRYHDLNKLCKTCPDPKRVATVRDRFKSLRGVICMKEFLSGWFHDAPFTRLHRRNVEEFVAYGFYVKSLPECSPELRKEIKGFMHAADYYWDLQDESSLREGYDPSLSFMAHLWEPLRVVHKPLLFHLASEAGGLLSRGWLALQGFQHYRRQGMSYWIRRPTTAVQSQEARSSSSQLEDDLKLSAGQGPAQAGERSASGETFPGQAPIVFLHGVGFGLGPYLPFIKRVVQAHGADRAIVLPEVRQVSLRLCHRSLPVDALAGQLAAFLSAHAIPSACVVAHSYGTFVASRFLQLHRPMVEAMLLVDPVCLMTCAPRLLRNFIYKGPVLQDLTSIEGVFNALRFLVSRDLLIAEAFCRRFHWTELMLWPQEMPAKSAVVLSGKDDLVPSELVRKQFSAGNYGFPVLYADAAVHGGFLLDQHMQGQILQQLRLLLQD